MARTGSYIRFEEGVAPRGRITRVWRVVSASSGDRLGWVRWHAPWRRYCFSPVQGTIWSPDCLRDVATFCEKQTEARKLERTLEQAKKVMG